MSAPSDEAEKDLKHRIRTAFKQPIISTEVKFEKQIDIIKAYVVASKEGQEPTDYTQAAGYADVTPVTVSACNKFLIHIGVIRQFEDSNKYVATEEAVSFHRALNWSKEIEAKAILRGMISKSWFWLSAKGFLEVHGAVSKKDLMDKLGYDAGADPKKHTAAVGYLIEYMSYCGLLKAKDGLFEASGEAKSEERIGEGLKKVELDDDVARDTKGIGVSSSLPISVSLNFTIDPETSEEKVRSIIKAALDEIESRSRKGSEASS